MKPSKKNSTEKEKFRAEDVFSELTVQEAELIAVGDNDDQKDYLLFLLQSEHPAVGTKNRYLMAGMLLKRYSFTAAVLAIKNAQRLDDYNVLPKLLYAAGSYEKVFEASQAVSSETTEKAVRGEMESIRLRAMLADPSDTLFGFLLEGKISKAQYEKSLVDKELAKELIRKEWDNGVCTSESRRNPE
jgi:hypothetical protein